VGKKLNIEQKEVSLALRNALKLTFSMLSTIAISVLVRLYVPRFLGPELFGTMAFAEAFAATFYTFATLGVDTYIRKEVAANPKHANDFYGGFFVVRTALCVVLLFLALFGVHLLHKDKLTFYLVFLFSLGQIAFIDNFTLGTFLQAASIVNALSLANIVSKLIWFSSIFIGIIYFKAGVIWIAFSFFLSELLKTIYLAQVAHHALGIHFHVHFMNTFRVIWLSLPYFLNNVALRVYEKLNVILLSHFSSNIEVGWYSAGLTIAGFSLLFIPIVQAVIMPMAARIGKTSIDGMNHLMQQGAQITVVLGAQIAIVLALNAHYIVQIAFGSNFIPAKMGLMMIAPMFPLTYLATICSLHLIQQNRNWMLIRMSLLAVVLNPILNFIFIPQGTKLWGPGGAGMMSALATVITEFVVCVANLWVLGKAQLVPRFWQVITRTLLICFLVVVFHSQTQGLHSLLRLCLDGFLYLLLMLAFKTLPPGAIQGMLKAFRGRLGSS
jgi:O-antigen/teichoic acid export membrane protein